MISISDLLHLPYTRDLTPYDVILSRGAAKNL